MSYDEEQFVCSRCGIVDADDVEYEEEEPDTPVCSCGMACYKDWSVDSFRSILGYDDHEL